MPPAVGTRFGRYELREALGAGGMGEVFRARDCDLQRDVAVKFLPARYTSDPERLARFAIEARAASSLNHPNIVTIHEIGETSGQNARYQTPRARFRRARPAARNSAIA
jgi:serine/threonine protein kinase